MSASVIWTHQIVERDQTPLDIPPRPPAARDVEFTELPNRLWTYRASIGAAVIGYIRHSPDDVWIARTLGSATAAASIRKFPDRAKAASWLQSRLIGGRC
jgi:hypothetical protein